MRKKKSDEKALNHAKNLARGALGKLTQEVRAISQRGDTAPVEKTPAWVARQEATFGLNEAIATARTGLSKSDLKRFNDWLQKSLPSLDFQSTGLGVPLASLGIFPTELVRSGLDKELSSSVSRLQSRLPEIIEFARKAKKISEDIGKRNYGPAGERLNDCMRKDGFSFWYIESYLALTTLEYGIEKLKKEVERLSVGGQGHQRFLFHYFGVRNEPAQSSMRFRASVKRVIEESKISTALKNYLKFRLYGALEPRPGILADILAYEQTRTHIDLFFTVIKVFTLVVSQRRTFPHTTISLAEGGLMILADALDALSVKPGRMESQSLETGELATQSLNYLLDDNSDVETKWSDLQAVSAVAAQLSTTGRELHTDETSKAFINMSWLPVVNAIGEIQNIPSLPQLLTLSDVGTLATPFVNQLHQAISIPSDQAFTPSAKEIILKFWHVCQLRREGNLKDVNSFLEQELQAPLNGNVEDAFAVLYAHTLFEEGELQRCMSVCANAGRKNERLLPLLPFNDLFIGKRWNSLRSLGPSVDLPISLSHASRAIEDGKLRTFKRYATEELMTQHSCMTIDELIPKLAKSVTTDVVAYFGYNVCDIATIELLPGMGDSRMVRRTRVALLRKLAELQTARAMIFETEAQELEDALQVDDGLSVLDDSKVHVDEEAVTNYVVAEYQADFQRYQQLVASGIGKAESVADILKYADTPSARIFQIPKNDADDLLVELATNIRRRFLFDPASGLDIIMGRRIRHNTISSELRGMLEKENLIGTIHHGRYQPSSNIVRLCNSLDPKQKKIIYAANIRFSDSIDQVVALLRDQYFNVRSKSKSRGVFDLTINSVLFAVMRTAAQNCNSLEAFTRECIDGFWLFLSLKLEIARQDVEGEIKRMLRLSFQKFSSELVAQNADLALISSVQRAAEELQRRAATIASWIAVPKLRLQARYYGLSKTIDISVALVSGQVPAFKPVVRQNVIASIELDFRGFSIVSDALYVVIDNIAQHSGKKTNNLIDIDITFNVERSLLVFDVTNEIAPSARKPDKIQRLSSIRTDIQRRSFIDGARRNKHSGLYKLAALVHHSGNANLSFDFVGKDKFNVKFELSYVPFTLNDPKS